MKHSDVQLSLTYDEALVLSDWLFRISEAKRHRKITSDKSEIIALCALECALEPLIDEVFSPDYSEVVQGAKARLLGGSD